jgi:hypothetical protein
MLRIRPEQLAELDRRAQASFERELVAYVRQYFPLIASALGDDSVAVAIHDGLARAARHGIRAQRDQSRWVALMFTFGLHFDSDPALPWIAKILDDPELTPATYKMDVLYAEAGRNC